MIKFIAFYLPQFHPIPENDRWWGKGFTEWNNVRSAKPQFNNHYQPHIPSPRLGYYDLRNPDILSIQAEIAQEFGIYGFCYYYYWFNGVKLLDFPINTLIKNNTIPKRFCVCWANSNWTRAWYGQKKDVLISQTYSTQNAKKFANDICLLFCDNRYITINNRPLFLIFEPELIPEPKMYTDQIRESCLKRGLENPIIANVEAFSWGCTPSKYGCDIAVEFAPDWRCLGPLINDKGQVRQVSYKTTIINMVAKKKPDYTLIRTVFPMWDNTPRYKNAAMIIQNDSSSSFSLFLNKTIEHTILHNAHADNIIFINAWNEWGEGCHLEPDRKFGYTWLRIIQTAQTN